MKHLKILRGLPYHWLMPLCFFCVGLIYIYAVPHFEASDSIAHVGMIKWIADHDGALPIQSADHSQLYRQQASQPPLYYFMMAAIWTALDTSDFDEFFRLTPFAIVGDPMRLGNRNRLFYRQPYPPNLHQGTSSDALRHSSGDAGHGDGDSGGGISVRANDCAAACWFRCASQRPDRIQSAVHLYQRLSQQ